ncbi:ImmA/IrrE family metallo-endopeptidase [Zavarzinia sp.]|uniref:ImmA/IrrE family metallo-endopeptidase n=1 Tax=Zavarzinia sp. TaxID=2027920 RepID=UPI003BB6ED65
MIKHSPSNDFEPNWAVPPGVTISAILSSRAVSRESFAEAVGESVESVQRLLLGLRSVDEHLADRLARCLGPSSAFWLAREAQYRADFQRIQSTCVEIACEVWVKQFPVREMVKLGWIDDFQSTSEAAGECFKLFGVPDVAAWNVKYAGASAAAAFRMSASARANPGAITAWLRWAELIAELTPCADWDPELFKENLQAVRSLTWQKDPATFLPKLRKLCAEAGVSVVVARTPKGCPASGATRFLSPNKALMVLSFRYRSDDQFWFTFFHEAAHLLLHSGDAIFLEDESEVTSDEEGEANEFAAEVLIPRNYLSELLNLPLRRDPILRFARRIGVSPGIVVGQLQHYKRISLSHMNWLKRRYDWNQISMDKITL